MGYGIKLKQILDMKKMSVLELSKKSGIPAPTIYAIIRRDSDRVSSDVLNKIIEALGDNQKEKLGITVIFSGADEDLLALAEEGKNVLEDTTDTLLESIHNAVEYGKNVLEEGKEALLLSKYRELNPQGKTEAIKRIDELTEIKKYTE